MLKIYNILCESIEISVLKNKILKHFISLADM
jgi:hypothetical protein